MNSLSASPTAATKATPLPRLYINHLPELDWLIAAEFGRTDDGQAHHRKTRLIHKLLNQKGLPMALTDDQLRVLTEIVGRETDGERGSVGSVLVAVGFETGEEPSREDVEAALLTLRKEDEADDE